MQLCFPSKSSPDLSPEPPLATPPDDPFATLPDPLPEMPPISSTGIFLRDIPYTAMIGEDCYGNNVPQSIVVTCSIGYNLESASDKCGVPGIQNMQNALEGVIKYRYKHFYDFLQNAHFEVAERTGIPDSYIELRFPKALMYCAGGITVRSFGKKHGIHQVKSLVVDNLSVPCVVGTEGTDMPKKQAIIVTFAVFFRTRNLNVTSPHFHSLFGDLIFASSF
jgi:hypothetical protein